MAASMTIEDKIAHFLRLAEDASATQEERDTASTQAERLMIKHGIDRAMAQAADTNRDETITTDAIFFGGAYGEARRRAASQVAQALGLKTYRANMRGVDGNNSHANRVVSGFRLTVVGFESDLRDAMNLIRSLDVQSAVAMKAYAKRMKDAWYYYSAADKTRAKQSFAMAFGEGASDRILAGRAEAVREAGTGAAMVLVDRAAKVAKHLDTIPGLRNVHSRKRMINTAAYGAGHSAGYNANTGGGPAIGQRLSIGR